MDVTFDSIKKNPALIAYIEAGDSALAVLGYTEHAFPHVYRAAETASGILKQLGFSKRECELAKIAGLMHDIGNSINRELHSISGALLASRILENEGMPYGEIALIAGAIGNHDEGTGRAVSPIAAALILADKSDVRRSRVRSQELDSILADIHDRVNYAVTQSVLTVENVDGSNHIRLRLELDTSFCPVMDYFEIFTTRMQMCKRAAQFLGVSFELVINSLRIM